jgi:hypothetical protein
MIKHLILAAGVSLLSQVALCQQGRLHDSIMLQLVRQGSTLDSLRKKADDQYKVNQSLEKMVDVLSHSKDSATNGLAGWRRTYISQSAQFDSTLERLDSGTAALNRLNTFADSVFKSKTRKN